VQISKYPNCNDTTVSPFLTVSESIVDIDRNITILRNSLSLYPRSHSEYIDCVYDLAEERWARYQLSQEKQDLDKCIVHCTEAIFLPPVFQDGPDPNSVCQLFFLLVSALLARSDKFGQPEGVKYSIEYLRYLRGLPLDSFDIRVPRNLVTTSLIHALSIQVRLGDGSRNLKEMVVLCRELLTSNISTESLEGVFKSLNWAADAEFKQGRPIQLLGDVIECLQDAVKVYPGSYGVSLVLAYQLYNRFEDTHSKDDYEEATALLKRILDPDQPGDCPDSFRDQASFLATLLAYARSSIFRNPEYSEVAISRLRTLLSSPSIDEGLRLTFTESLAIRARERFAQYSLAENLEEANSYTPQLVDLSSSESLEKSGILFLESDAARDSYSMTRMAEKIQHLEELLSVTPPGTEHHNKCLGILARWYESKFRRTNNISDIEESIKYGRLSVNATHSSDSFRSNPLAFLRDILSLAFEKSRKYQLPRRVNHPRL
jgi:tetratricopeptide (TPR) repeat protein